MGLRKVRLIQHSYAAISAVKFPEEFYEQKLGTCDSCLTDMAAIRFSGLSIFLNSCVEALVDSKLQMRSWRAWIRPLLQQTPKATNPRLFRAQSSGPGPGFQQG